MDSENKKVVVNLPEGATQAEVVIREGAAEKLLDPKAPVKINLSGVIGAPVEFLTKRISEEDQINPKRCHVLVDRQKVSITRVTSENDHYNPGKVPGVLQPHPKFIASALHTSQTLELTGSRHALKMKRALSPL